MVFTEGCRILAERCVDGIEAVPERTEAMVHHSIGLVTALNPVIGYAKATEIAAEALRSGRGVAELVLEHGLISSEALETLLRPDSLVGDVGA